jgi:hypothetical protein
MSRLVKAMCAPFMWLVTPMSNTHLEVLLPSHSSHNWAKTFSSTRWMELGDTLCAAGDSAEDDEVGKF